MNVYELYVAIDKTFMNNPIKYHLILLIEYRFHHFF